MRKNPTHKTIWDRLRRGMAGILSLVMLLGLMPAAQAEEDSWAAPYMQQLIDWNIMRSDLPESKDAERAITRAEFLSLINRAYGYDQIGEIPFTDISGLEWYADDVAIAYNVGYFAGTSDVTASPLDPLTREQGALLLAKNMMMQANPGEVLDFADGRSFSSWSRGIMRAVAESGIISGYPDGTFRPQNNISRGEAAAMLVKAIGQPVSTGGVHSLGSVYGNVTVNTSGVTLRDTTIAGDLYLTGGIGLGDVLLENVSVLGRIIASGGGESSGGQNSVLLRNVSASEMIVDSIGDHFVTIRTEGDTDIGTTSVRTSSYLEDVTPKGYGMHRIEIDGESGMNVQLAGNIKEVVNKTPASRLVLAQGVVGKVTVDEQAVGSALVIDGSARAEEVNLDVGTGVTGEGDIDHLNVNAPGSNVTILPDTITVRPGITANINSETMDTVAAAESSEDPRLLSGYPAARDVAPTSAQAVFSTNKRGTVYWAVSALADGSIGAEELISPPAYGGKAVRSGSIQVTASKTEVSAPIAGLTSDGSYYLSAVLVDARGQNSPVKVTSFTTPDNSVPGFGNGYPYMSRIANRSAQVAVMTTKSCQLFYALMPSGSTAPRPQDFKTGALSGNLGYGSLDAVKNSTLAFTVNSIDLEETTAYDLYLWLNDYNGAQSSEVRRLSFTTIDGTPPIIREMEQTDAKANSVELTYVLNEPGTLYWAIVKEGEDFLRPLSGMATPPELTDTAAKSQVESGIGAVQKGSSTATQAEAEVKFVIGGLEAEGSYDVYYVAKDRAGNYSESVRVITVNTEDGVAPTVIQEFTKYNGEDKNTPLPDTSIRLVFNEGIQHVTQDLLGKPVYTPLIDLYEEVVSSRNTPNEMSARETMAQHLRECFTMYCTSTGQPVEVVDRGMNPSAENWVVDYRYAVIVREDGKMVVTLPTNPNSPDTSALNLASGATYYFHVENIADTAISPTQMGGTDLPRFRTVFARVNLEIANEYEIEYGGGLVEIDMDFFFRPEATDRVDETMLWDMLIWADSNMDYQLYSRPIGAGDDAWELEGSASLIVGGGQDGFAYNSLTRNIRPNAGQPVFGSLRDIEPAGREFGIHLTRLGTSSDRTSWNQRVVVRITVVAGGQFGLTNLSQGSYLSDWNTAQQDYELVSIGLPDPFEIRKMISATEPPSFTNNHPSFNPGDTYATMNVTLDRPGQVFYAAVPLTSVTYRNDMSSSISDIIDYESPVMPSLQGSPSQYPEHFVVDDVRPLPALVPETGQDRYSPLYVSVPDRITVTGGGFNNNRLIKTGSTETLEPNVTSEIRLTGLSADTIYYVYVVTKGVGAVYSDTMVYRFKTVDAIRPLIDMDVHDPAVSVTVDRPAVVDYIIVPIGKEDSRFLEPFRNYAVANPSLPAAYQNISVLEAMATRVVGSDGRTYEGSVFDKYATTAAKATYAELIRASRTNGNTVIDNGTLNFTEVENEPNYYLNAQDVTSEFMQGFNPHVVIAVGRSSADQGSGDAFRAAQPVSNRDTESPYVTNALLSQVDLGTNKTIANGTLLLVFNEGLYNRSGSGTNTSYSPLDNCAIGGTSGHPVVNPSHTPVVSLAMGVGGMNVRANGTHDDDAEAITQILLSLKNAGDGASVTFSPTLCDSTGNNWENVPLTVTLRVDPVRVEDGTNADGTIKYKTEYRARVEITRGWDGRDRLN